METVKKKYNIKINELTVSSRLALRKGLKIYHFQWLESH